MFFARVEHILWELMLLAEIFLLDCFTVGDTRYHLVLLHLSLEPWLVIIGIAGYFEEKSKKSL